MKNLQIPLSIVVAGLIVAGAIIFSGSSGDGSIAGAGGIAGAGDSSSKQQVSDFGNNNSAQANNVRPVDGSRDHIKGTLDAKVTVIEYSDFECPFCARFHPTLEKLTEDFGGEVAWVYRHFPLTSIHSQATGAAIASECISELGGNNAFWDFASQAFRNQRNLGTEFYVNAAVELGISKSEFTDCINSGRHDERIQEDLDNVILAGGSGTPFSVVINEKGEVFPFSGALPYESVRSIIEQALEG